MSIPRYKINPLFGYLKDSKEGKFCEYRDYVRLQAENEYLKRQVKVSEHNSECFGLLMEKEISNNLRLKAEVERLTKAGDNLVYVASEHPVSEPFVKAWFTAKKGGQP